MPPDFLPEGIDVEPGWIAFRYDDCSRILRDAKTFTSTGYDSTIGMVMGHMILGMDDPEHRSHRNLVAHAFREKSLARWEPEFIGPIIDELIDRFVADGEADLVRQLTFEFPVRVISRLLGLPEEDFAAIPALVDRADRPGGRHRPRAGRLGVAARLFRRRRGRTPGRTRRGRHQRPGHGRDRRREADRRGHLLLPAPAAPGRGRDHLPLVGQPALPAADPPRAARRGAQTTARCSPRPSRRPALRAAAADHQPDHHLRGGDRRGDHRPPARASRPNIGSANHDETRWEDPEVFDIFRPAIPHIAFAHGPHMCLGHAPGPARDPGAASTACWTGCPTWPSTPATRDPHIRGEIFRSPTALPVTFTPAA